MEIADTDGSGTIDFVEFKDLISKLDDEQDEASLKTIFDD
jgi:Ca2+-binding EF-hand superfamily protein